MTLQLRVRHSLGARMIQVESRAADRANRIGRDPEAEVQIPSSAVAPVHCRLYCQDDQWVIEDCGGAGGTCVNGARITQPTYLKSGDAIALAGANIEIDPMGLLRRNAPASARPAAPTEETIAAQSFVEDSGAEADDPQYEEQAPDSVDMQSGLSDPAAALASGESDGAGDLEQPDAWIRPATAAIVPGWPGSKPYRGYRHRKTNPTGWIALGVTLAVIIVFGAILIGIIFKKEEPPPPVIVKQEPKKVVEQKKPDPAIAPLKQKKNIFDDDAGPQKTGTVVAPTPQPKKIVQPIPPAPPANADAQPAPARNPPEPDKPADPRTQTEDWKNLLEANGGSNYARAIWVNEDYRQRHPGELADEVKKKTDEALDSLWWQRIRELCQTRERTTKEIRKLTDDIAAETEVAYKKKLEVDKQKKQDLVESITSMLKDDYGYSAAEPPNEYDVEQIAKLRAARDGGRYGKWCERIVKYVRTENGALPWQSR